MFHECNFSLFLTCGHNNSFTEEKLLFRRLVNIFLIELIVI